MKVLTRIRFIEAILIITITCLSSTLANSNSRGNDSEDEKNKKKRIIFLPIFYYTPETRIAGGALINIIFREPGSDPTTKPSSILPLFVYTQNKQIILEILNDLYWKNETYITRANLSFQRFPDKFYGIGNNTSFDDEENYTPKLYHFEFGFMRQLIPHLYSGFRYEYENYRLIEIEPDGRLASGTIQGTEGGKLSGLGIYLNWDSRDNIFYAKSGNYLEISLTSFPEILGSNYQFRKFLFDFRKYYSLYSNQIIALQAMYRRVGGDPPFHRLALLGGSKVMRGYYQGRFRDKQLMVLQSEYRLHLFWRIGMVGFLGIGDVFNKLQTYELSDTKVSAGLGLRFSLNPQEKINIRIDFGFGRDSSGLYITMHEAF